MRYLLILLVLAVVGVQLFVRLAPVDSARWHSPPVMPGEGTGTWVDEGQVHAAADFDASPDTVLARLDEIALATSRTARIAGSPSTGLVTYMTRSRIWGFPDFTTVAAEPRENGGTRLLIHGRLRFGQGDFGVNARRVRGWLARLRQAG